MPDFLSPCGHPESGVIRTVPTAHSIRRRRECPHCDYRFWTFEQLRKSDLERAALLVACSPAILTPDPCAAPIDLRKIIQQIGRESDPSERNRLVALAAATLAPGE